MIHSREYITACDARDWHRRFPTWLGIAADLKPSSYMVPPHRYQLVVTRDEAGQESLLSNVCTHRQALMHQGTGKLGSRVVCPVHRWNWDHSGQLLGARGFDREPCMDLERFDLHQWRGHMWTGPDQWISEMPRLAGLDAFVDARWFVPADGHQHRVLEFAFDWKIFMEIYLDLYHVACYHPGLSNLTDARGFGYHVGNGWSCQTAAFNRGDRISDSYRDVASIYRKTGLWDSSRFGAVWLGIYPNTMLEFYPGVLVVSTVWPSGAGRCTNHLDFLYDPSVLETNPGFPETFERYFMRTSDEDEDIGLRMQAGLASLDQWIEPRHHDPEESGIGHFHRWLIDRQLVGSTTRCTLGDHPPL